MGAAHQENNRKGKLHLVAEDGYNNNERLKPTSDSVFSFRSRLQSMQAADFVGMFVVRSK